MRRFLHDEERRPGTIVPMFALLLVPLLGILALSIDVAHFPLLGLLAFSIDVVYSLLSVP